MQIAPFRAAGPVGDPLRARTAGRLRSGARWVVVAGLAIGAAACGRPPEPPRPAPDPQTRRTLPDGEVVGFTTERGAHAWRGIPYAEPPIGDLRWRAPRPPPPWSGVREALDFGPPCPQFAGPMGGRDGAREGSVTGDEDCLRLHVYAPPFAPAAVPQGDGRLPVMVWIHGGGNTIGEAALYEASPLVLSERVVLVEMNYRLGALGWFYHPALAAGDVDAADASGNYGTLDLVRALEWVRDHASAFGGDPGNVTIFGESAGGANVFSLLLSPRARGLFHRAIAQSGGLRTVTLDEASNLSDDPDAPGHPASSGEALATWVVDAGLAPDRAAARSVLATWTPEREAAFARSRTPGELLAAYAGTRLGGMYDAPRLLRDGFVLPRGEPLAALARAAAEHPVPVVLGTNRDENKLFLLFGSPWFWRVRGVPWRLADPRRFDLDARYLSLMWKASGADEPAAALHAAQGGGVFVYRFDWDEEPRILWMDLGHWLGAAHAVELPFVFGHLDLGRAGRLLFDEDRRPAAETLSAQMRAYWSRFAETGDPGRGRTGELPRWAPWATPEDPAPRFLVLDTEAGGGLRMDGDVVSREVVLERLARDPGFESSRERCALVAWFVRFGRRVDETEYATVADGMCAGFPLESLAPAR